MAPASGGDLASAVAAAGALGLLGIGYADTDWFERESAKVTQANVGAVRSRVLRRWLSSVWLLSAVMQSQLHQVPALAAASGSELKTV